MPQHLDADSRLHLQSLSEAVLSLIEWPAAIVADGEEIIAHNALWAHVARCSSDPAQRRMLDHALRDFAPTEALFDALRCGSSSVGVITALRAPERSSRQQPVRHEYAVRWRQLQLQMQPKDRGLAVVVLQSTSAAERPASGMPSQQTRINQLLIQQTLIEETERRRLGQSLHDAVAQNLAQIRAAILPTGFSAGERSQIIAGIDRVIDDVRTLAFELSPPVLEDLGLRPALQWLAEHLSFRFGTHISVADDASEPRLSKAARTIVFRAVRELSINAAKHAPGSEIVISCIANRRAARITVRDTGPGFDTDLARSAADGAHSFGLLSVEQQIRGIGGSFDLVSNVGDGTRATIMVPLKPEEDAGHD